MALTDKSLVWPHGAVKGPPFTPSARLEAGVLLRRVQRGEKLGMPHSRSMPSIGSRCHELRIPDAQATWRILYRIDFDAIVILEVFSKKTQATPQHVIQVCRQRLRTFEKTVEEEEE
jgi:phage-related protein